MLWTDRNGKMHSTLSGAEMLALTNTDDFIENTKIVAEKTGSLDLWHEMFGDADDAKGQDSAFMDDIYGG